MDSLHSINKVYSVVAQEESNTNSRIVINKFIILTNAYNVNISTYCGSSSDKQHHSGIPSVITCFVSNKSNLWLLDLGKHDHICFSKNCLKSFYCIRPIKFHFPNANSV